MKEFITGAVTVATAFIGASIVYQIVKPGSQGPIVTGQIANTAYGLGGFLFK
jgi:hypothetical protein